MYLIKIKKTFEHQGHYKESEKTTYRMGKAFANHITGTGLAPGICKEQKGRQPHLKNGQIEEIKGTHIEMEEV